MGQLPAGVMPTQMSCDVVIVKMSAIRSLLPQGALRILGCSSLGKRGSREDTDRCRVAVSIAAIRKLLL